MSTLTHSVLNDHGAQAMLMILDAPSGDMAEITKAREAIAWELGHPANVVMLIVGDDPAIAEFASAAGRLAGDDWRRVVWVRSREILDAARQADLGEHTAVLYDRQDVVASRLKHPMQPWKIDEAFRKAEIR